MGYVIEILVLQAMSLQAQGKTDQALAPLERALAVAESEGYERTFIDEGIPMGKMLRQAVMNGIAVGYAGKLLSALEMEKRDRLGSRTVSHKAMVEPLSEREIEVLRLLKTHLSSTAIAEELTISVNTVRTHIKSIYSKLNVHNRQDAVQRAQEIELL
jgi:LuxR family maltose regulon positive regulatory protein